MKKTNTLKFCYTQKAPILGILLVVVSCIIVTLLLIPIPILPYLPFVEVDSSKLELFFLFLLFDILILMPTIYLGIILNIKVIHNRLKINKLLPENFCLYNSDTKEITIQDGNNTHKFHLSKLKEISIVPPEKSDYSLCGIKVTYDKIKKLCFTLTTKDKITLPEPFLKNINQDIETIKTLK